MTSKNKKIFWTIMMILFYTLTSYMGIYSMRLISLWPYFALPMSIFILKTDEIELAALIGIVLSVAISFLETGSFNPINVSAFLLFILLPSLVFGKLYNKSEKVPWIIIITSVTVFASSILLIAFNKLLGIDYVSLYFELLDEFKLLLEQNILNYINSSNLKNTQEANRQVLHSIILIAKRTYPAMLFAISLFNATIHFLAVQFIARVRYWKRLNTKDMFYVGLSPIAAWGLIILIIISYRTGNVDTMWTFAIENMVSILITLFKIIGLISIVTLIMGIKTKKFMRVLVMLLSLLWLLANPSMLIIIGCIDSMFNIRKVETLI